jgi:hypothetical protein
VEEMQGDSASCLKGQKGAALNFIRQGSEGRHRNQELTHQREHQIYSNRHNFAGFSLNWL